MVAPSLIRVQLPPLHRGRDILEPCPYCGTNSPGEGGQVAIEASRARFKVVKCGRRYGKTTLGVSVCVKGACDTGGIYWWVAPTYKTARVGWRMLKFLANQIPGTDIKEGEKCITFPNGGEVYIMSADNEGSLRSEGLNGLVIDEADDVREERWIEELLPALTDKQGWVLFIGTPKGGWFTKLYEDCAEWPNWERWSFWTENNPTIELEAVKQARAIMTPDEFEQEFHANVRAGKYLVYPAFNRKAHRWLELTPPFVCYYGGLDFGGTSIGSHKSAGTFSGLTRDGIKITLAEFEQSGPNIAERQVHWIGMCEAAVAANAERDGGQKNILWFADKTQMFGIQLMMQAGVRVFPSKGGKDSVQEGITICQRRMEFREGGPSNSPKARWYYLPHLRHLPDALERYRYAQPEEGKPQPMNPMKIDDDICDSWRYEMEGSDLLVLGDPRQLYKNLLPVVG